MWSFPAHLCILSQSIFSLTTYSSSILQGHSQILLLPGSSPATQTHGTLSWNLSTGRPHYSPLLSCTYPKWVLPPQWDHMFSKAGAVCWASALHWRVRGAQKPQTRCLPLGLEFSWHDKVFQCGFCKWPASESLACSWVHLGHTASESLGNRSLESGLRTSQVIPMYVESMRTTVIVTWNLQRKEDCEVRGHAKRGSVDHQVGVTEPCSGYTLFQPWKDNKDLHVCWSPFWIDSLTE